MIEWYDRTIIDLSYRKISWYVSVLQINYWSIINLLVNDKSRYFLNIVQYLSITGTIFLLNSFEGKDVAPKKLLVFTLWTFPNITIRNSTYFLKSIKEHHKSLIILNNKKNETNFRIKGSQMWVIEWFLVKLGVNITCAIWSCRNFPAAQRRRLRRM